MKEAKNATVAFNQQDKKVDRLSIELAKKELAEIEAKENERKVHLLFL